MIWPKMVPLKVSLFDWRLLRNHLPTKDNLINQTRCASKQCTTLCGRVRFL
uniref:Reverse transcriptase zinc-binding domain-containing protein n=1 Tax=Medicago truncatula TaxID=3880 RepID=A2Q1Y3_MEDTR|nr:hypothetical protein MtrDRAFT_AC149131g33v2 [Medicago truncatula]